MGAEEVSAFLSSLAGTGHVSASTQNQALSALLFLYGGVLGRPLGTLDTLDTLVRAQSPVRIPVVLRRDEVTAILARLGGSVWLIASLMYGAGLRVLECCELRVKDVDVAGREIRVRDGKGRKDRVTMLPGALAVPLREQVVRVGGMHEADVAGGGH